jgi:hypothetical protein
MPSNVLEADDLEADTAELSDGHAALDRHNVPRHEENGCEVAICERIHMLAKAWQPIETAPKDGTKVLLYWKPLPYAKRKWGTIRLGRWNGSSWQMEMGGLYRCDCTHWMPLPLPPADRSDVENTR